MKKLLVFTLIFALLISALAACGDGGKRHDELYAFDGVRILALRGRRDGIVMKRIILWMGALALTMLMVACGERACAFARPRGDRLWYE